MALVPESGMYALLEKGAIGKEEIIIEAEMSVSAPITKGQVLGKAKCIVDGKVVAERNLIAANDVGKIGLGALLKKLSLTFKAPC